MVQQVVEFPSIINRTHIQFANRIAHAVAAVGRSMRVAGVRRMFHQYAHELRRHRRRSHPQSFNSALAVCDASLRKIFPRPFVLVVHGVAVANPVLHFEISCIRLGPVDADCIHVFFLVERHDDPLRVKRIVLSGEFFAEIGIALPVRLRVAIIQAREAIELRAAVPREAAVAQLVAIGMPDHFFRRSRVADEVSFAARIAPLALRIPMPCLHEQVRILPVTHHSPARRQHFLNLVRAKEHVGSVARHAIHSRAQRVERAELVHHMAGRRVHGDHLRDGIDRAAAECGREGDEENNSGSISHECSSDCCSSDKFLPANRAVCGIKR